MKRKLSRLLAMLLAVLMMVSTVPAAYALDLDEEPVGEVPAGEVQEENQDPDPVVTGADFEEAEIPGEPKIPEEPEDPEVPEEPEIPEEPEVPEVQNS